MKKKLPIILIIISLGYYWFVPAIKLLFQYGESSKNVRAIVSAVPDPVIEKVYILPSYEKINNYVDCGQRPRCWDTTYNIKDGKNTILIVGKNFQSIDSSNPIGSVNISVNGQNFSPYKSDDSTASKIVLMSEYYAVQVEDNYIKFEVDSSLLLKQHNEITVTRDGKSSRTFSLSSDDVGNQLSLAESGSPSIIAAIPVGYPLNQYWAQGVDVLFIVTGLPKHYLVGNPEESVSCTFIIDSKSYNQCHGDNIENLNINKSQIELNKSSHEAMIILENASSLPYKFDTIQFEQIGKEKQKVNNTYAKSISAKNSVAGGQIPLLGQNKNGSLPALGINIFLTLIFAFLLRPWRNNNTYRWIITFFAPVILQALAGFVFGVLLLDADFLGPLAGLVLIKTSLIGAIVPLVEGTIVAIVLTYSIRYLRSFNTVTTNTINTPSQL